MKLAADVQGLVNEIVAEWVSGGKMFTAFEVSLEAKKRGVHERHRNLREFVHEVIFRLGIERTTGKKRLACHPTKRRHLPCR